MYGRNRLGMDGLTPNWSVAPEIKAFSTFRTGGVSQGIYSSLNLAEHVGDDYTKVAINRKILNQALGLSNAPVWLKQVHGNHIVQADSVISVKSADASYTVEKKVACVVLTADCLPILLCHQDGGGVAAVHAGWRGLMGNIIESAIEALGNHGLIAWLGPAIGPDSFEVSPELRRGFLQKSENFELAFRHCGGGKWLADLYEIARIILTAEGVGQIFGGGYCTYSDESRFFSYRRDGATGRMATLIWRE